MPKVSYEDLESITKFLDKINKRAITLSLTSEGNKELKQSIKLSKMIKDKYTEIKPDYERKS